MTATMNADDGKRMLCFALWVLSLGLFVIAYALPGAQPAQSLHALIRNELVYMELGAVVAALIYWLTSNKRLSLLVSAGLGAISLVVITPLLSETAFWGATSASTWLAGCAFVFAVL